jgi:hypothetical protein
LESRYVLSIHHHGITKHRQRADPEGVITVETAIDHQLFFGLAVTGRSHDLVIVSLVVAIAAGSKFIH